MLITNFSAGELSKTLFGRTDIPQYYSGASRLENFDVIPTGGLKRRGGTEHVMPLEGNGRIIPFIVNRDLSFLLYLTPGKITKYKLEKNKTEMLGYHSSGKPIKLYQDIKEIREVQYTQNFDTMVIVHEKYRPIILKLKNDNLDIEYFEIDLEIDLPQEGINKNNYKEFDKFYEENNWLSVWPRAATFFNNRLVLAGTRNNRQRIFASSSGNFNNFSTYKKFVSETKEYVTICGILDCKKNEIEIILSLEYGKFVQGFKNYYLQSPYFPEGTRLDGIIGNKLQFKIGTTNIKTSQEEIIRLINWKNEINDSWSDLKYLYFEFDGAARGLGFMFYFIQYSVGKIRFGSSAYYDGRNIGWEIIELPDDSDLYLNNYDNNSIFVIEFKNYLYEFIYNKIGRPTTSGNGDYVFKEGVFNQFINDFYNNIQNTMKYKIIINGHEKIFYGRPTFIYQQIMVSCNITYIEFHKKETFFTFYIEKEPLIDRYPTPDCGFTFEIASDTNDAIQWLAVNKGLIVGTETGEWIIPPDVHATNVQAVLNSRYGSDKMQGTAIGDATCFFQTGKKSLVEYYIPQQDNNFRANNMAMLSDDMLRGSPAVDFDYTNSPYTKLIITREDGQAVTLLYERSTGTFAWSRLITNGKIMSVAVIPNSDGYDDIFMIVERSEERTLLWDDPPNTPTVTRKYFLEALRENSDVYLDCYMPVTFRKQVDSDGAEVTNSTPMYMRISLLGYGNESVVYDKVENKIYPVKEITDNSLLFEKEYFIGYKYTSRVVSMPILANNSMKPNNIKNLLIRFLDSFLPKLIAHPNGAKDIIPGKEPFSGVKKTMFPGVWDHDVMFELYHDAPTRCKILAINTEVN